MEPCHRAWLHFNVFVGRTSNLKSIYTLAQSGRNPGTVKPDTNYEMLPNLKQSLCSGTKTIRRKQETVMTILRIGHTWITHRYLLKKEDQPRCHACHSPYTVKHVFIGYPDFTPIRNKYYTTTDIHTLFREVDT